MVDLLLCLLVCGTWRVVVQRRAGVFESHAARVGAAAGHDVSGPRTRACTALPFLPVTQSVHPATCFYCYMPPHSTHWQAIALLALLSQLLELCAGPAIPLTLQSCAANVAQLFLSMLDSLSPSETQQADKCM